MSKVQEDQDNEDTKTEHTEVVKSDKEDIKGTEAEFVPESETDLSAETEKEEDQKEKPADGEEVCTLTEEEIVDLRKKAEERDSYLDQLLRSKAEFLNYQKRMRKENESAAQFAIQSLILDLFPELDNFERALKLVDSAKDFDKFVEGIKLIEDQLFKVLGKYGVSAIETEGKAFDPNLHEAVMEEENNKLPHHTIIAELQKGFLLKERVIRPSKVKVSKRTIEEEKTENAGD